MPSNLLSSLGALSEQSKWRQQNEVLDRQQKCTEHSCQSGGQSQVAFSKPAEARVPQMPSMLLRSDARQLRERVVHVKHFVVKNLVEHGAGRLIMLQHIAIHAESTRRSPFR